MFSNGVGGMIGDAQNDGIDSVGAEDVAIRPSAREDELRLETLGCEGLDNPHSNGFTGVDGVGFEFGVKGLSDDGFWVAAPSFLQDVKEIGLDTIQGLWIMAASFTSKGGVFWDGVTDGAALDHADVEGSVFVEPALLELDDDLRCDADGGDAVFRLDARVGGATDYIDIEGDIGGATGCDLVDGTVAIKDDGLFGADGGEVQVFGTQ